jgi:hypothetical protein
VQGSHAPPRSWTFAPSNQRKEAPCPGKSRILQQLTSRRIGCSRTASSSCSNSPIKAIQPQRCEPLRWSGGFVLPRGYPPRTPQGRACRTEAVEDSCRGAQGDAPEQVQSEEIWTSSSTITGTNFTRSSMISFGQGLVITPSPACAGVPARRGSACSRMACPCCWWPPGRHRQRQRCGRP